MLQPITFSQRIQFLINRAEQTLSSRRLLHLFGVTHTVSILATVHQLNVESAALAGLLHDQSKDLPSASIRQDLERAGEPIPDEELEFSNTWHGYHAALLAQTELGLNCPELLEAVRLHTTSDACVGPLTKALFIADLCEPSRGIEIAPEILTLAQSDLDDGFCKALAHKLSHVQTRKKSRLHPRAIRALRHYLSLSPEELLKNHSARL